MIQELETLRADINKRIDEIKAKIEKPAFEVGVPYRYEDSNSHLVWFTDIEKQEGYGFDNNGFNPKTIWLMDKLIKANKDYVQAALEKEAVKRGFKEGVLFKHDGLINEFGKEVVAGERKITSLNFDYENNVLRLDNHVIYSNGTWATPIKTMSIDEIVMDLCNLFKEDKRKYLIKNKSLIIETLNNLENGKD